MKLIPQPKIVLFLISILLFLPAQKNRYVSFRLW